MMQKNKEISEDVAKNLKLHLFLSAMALGSVQAMELNSSSNSVSDLELVDKGSSISDWADEPSYEVIIKKSLQEQKLEDILEALVDEDVLFLEDSHYDEERAVSDAEKRVKEEESKLKKLEEDKKKLIETDASSSIQNIEKFSKEIQEQQLELSQSMVELQNAREKLSSRQKATEQEREQHKKLYQDQRAELENLRERVKDRDIEVLEKEIANTKNNIQKIIKETKELELSNNKLTGGNMGTSSSWAKMGQYKANQDKINANEELNKIESENLSQLHKKIEILKSINDIHDFERAKKSNFMEKEKQLIDIEGNLSQLHNKIKGVQNDKISTSPSRMEEHKD